MEANLFEDNALLYGPENPMDTVTEFMQHPFNSSWNEEPFLDYMIAYGFFKEYGDEIWIVPYEVYHDHHYVTGLMDLKCSLEEELSELNEETPSFDQKKTRCNELSSLIEFKLKFFFTKYPKLKSIVLDK
jgi:hypothetical protein